MTTITLDKIKILGRDKYARYYCHVTENTKLLINLEQKFKKKEFRSPLTVKATNDVYFICRPPKFYEFCEEIMETKELTDFKGLEFKIKLFAKAYNFTANDRTYKGWNLKVVEMHLL